LTLALATFAGGCAQGDEGAVTEPTMVSERDDSIRVMLDRMAPRERRAFVGERIDRALGLIVRDPQLREFVESLVNGAAPRVAFELVSDVSRLAERVGIRGFVGDALTATIERPGRASEPSRFSHVVNLAPECFVSDGRLVVVLLHEFLHMERRERGVPFESVAAEEVSVFTEGIRRANELAVALRLPPIGASIDPVEARVGGEIDAALAADRRYLAEWLRQPRAR